MADPWQVCLVQQPVGPAVLGASKNLLHLVWDPCSMLITPALAGGPFDPLGLADDPEVFQELQVKEIKNGRLALVAVLVRRV